MEVMKQSIEKLTNSNYGSWSFKMKAMLSGLDLWDVVENDCPVERITPATTSAPAKIENEIEIASWKKKNSKVFSYIVLHVDNNQISLIKKTTSAKQAWTNLKDYHQKSTASSLASVLKKIYSMKLEENGDAEAYLFEFEESFDKLSALGIELPEIVKAMTILISLPDSYKSMSSAISARPNEELTLSAVREKILDEYGKVKESCERLSAAFKISSSSFTCNYCKQPGHIKKNCEKLRAKQEFSGEKRNYEPTQAKMCFSAPSSSSNAASNNQKSLNELFSSGFAI